VLKLLRSKFLVIFLKVIKKNIFKNLTGGEKLGAFIDVFIDAAEDNWYWKEFLDCNITTGDLSVEILINGEVTNDGEKLRAKKVSASSFRFVRFSTRVDIMTSFDVQVSVSNLRFSL
jgi:hypothetical protein